MVDHGPPWFRWVEPASDYTIDAFWCERLDRATALDISNYSVYKADDITQTLAIQNITIDRDNLQITVTFTEPIEYAVRYFIEATGVKDEPGNVTNMEKMEFGNGPDLLFSSLQVTPTVIQDCSDPVAISYDVINSGNYAADPFSVSLWLRTVDGETTEDHFITEVQHEALEPDGAVHHELSILPPQAAAHYNYFIARVDEGMLVPERNEVNNEKTASFSTRVPRIVSIVDTPEDGGGWVDISFDRSLSDDPSSACPITTYEIYRKYPEVAGSALQDYVRAASGPVLIEILDRAVGTMDAPEYSTNERTGKGIVFAPADYFLDDWTLVETIAASFQERYSVSVPTAGIPRDFATWSTYFVRAKDSCGDLYYYSAPDSGYSYDNAVGPSYKLDCFLASVEGERVKLAWEMTFEEDGYEFVVKRSLEGGAFAAIDVDVFETGEGSYCFFDDVEPGRDYRYRLELSSGAGSYVIFETDQVRTPAVGLTLYQNHPNPFNPATEISYYLPSAGRVVIEIFDVAGRRIRTLVNGPQPAGRYSVEWTGQDNSGRRVASGIYFCRLSAGKETLTRKMVLMR